MAIVEKKQVFLTLGAVTFWRVFVHCQAIQYVYSAWFLVELLLRIAVDGRKLFVGEDTKFCIW